MKQAELKEAIRLRWNNRAESFDSSPGHGIHSQSEKAAWISLFTGIMGPSGTSVLDVGSGTGVLSLLLAEMGHKVTGVDLAEEMVQKARDKFKSNNLPAEFVIGDAENLPFRKQTFDIVINRHVVWSLTDPEKAFREWKRVLKKPGGRLIIIDGNWGRDVPTVRRIWRFFSRILILLTEFNNPWVGNQKLDRLLPMKQVKRPETDVEILKKLGFAVRVEPLNIPRWSGFLGYLKHGHHAGMDFLIVASL
ncbi:Ubiquinone/menaquinone biosynthesis C-methylase UbiE [Desulfotomaculum arcticum]|uniref:Ubiquinone/menaquinone biosynthesis C-methylase UbiE n=1 Tax=Desulfotruncus arcticus DSM 17038 TaxID=1121424 RepID=A0A1I2XPQ2_9FIRM|nr:class I SAM-dependent methyltransferase [Desulfotruncus arcticus]SFH15430.1 Ubiquinone/menaquinone biosynthesis C-methylase UbiE [Desulfotomaculum arcticum] [Desulfotruncus arcticus DSM 17038]